MAKTKQPRSFTDALATLAGHQFDVSAARDASGSGAKAFQVRKYGCAAEIAAAADGTTELLARPGWLLNGVISRLVTPRLPEVSEDAADGDSRDGGASARDP